MRANIYLSLLHGSHILLVLLYVPLTRFHFLHCSESNAAVSYTLLDGRVKGVLVNLHEPVCTVAVLKD